jgi:GNAT acetyltransferase-like protein
MPAYGNIEYIPGKKIDKEKWDYCITNASNGLIYAYSFYLDRMAKNWDGLVLEDYKAVMPLTWNRKYSIDYLYQPFVCAQLGLFGNNLKAELLNDFLKAIPSKFKYWDFYLNQQNVFELNDFTMHSRVNFVLNLEQPYEFLQKNYRENIRRNVKKAIQLDCRIEKNIAVEQVIGLAQKQMKTYTDKKGDFEKFKKLFEYLRKKEMANIYGVLSKKNQLLASAIFFYSHRRAYYILVGNDPDGRTLGASHFLIDAFIKENAGKKLLLDFEGSDIRNLAFFYSSFGAVEEKYPAIKLNRLPKLLKWMKS